MDYEHGGSYAIDPVIISFDEFKLDVARRILVSPSSTRRVPEKILAILVVLLRAGGLIISKTDLANAVWPEKRVSISNFNQHIFILRQLLGDNGATPQILITHRRRGFHLAVSCVREERGNVTEQPDDFALAVGA
jgi:DNA-binding winged helix-turn-helix (wHTH) protein